MSHDSYAPRKPVRQSRARETVDAILQASQQIVARHGLGRLTTNYIAELAGVSIGSLYQYFPGKDAVLHSVIERQFNRAVDAAIARVEAIDPAVVSLDAAIAILVDQVFDEQVAQRPLYHQFLLAALSFKQLRFTLDNDARVLASVREKLLAYGVEVDREGLPLATFVVLYALKGVQLGVAFGQHPGDDPALRALLVRLVRACVVAAPAPSAPA